MPHAPTHHRKPKGTKKHIPRLSRADLEIMAEIRLAQKCDKTALEGTFKNTSFKKLVREVGDEFKWGLRWTELSLIALAEAAQAHMDKLFTDAELCREHAGHKKLTLKDIRLAQHLQLPKA